MQEAEGSGFVLATSYLTWLHLCLLCYELYTSPDLLSVDHVQLAAPLPALAVLQRWTKGLQTLSLGDI